MECNYCNTSMEISTIKVKRPVPPGAKDLNLHDDVTCWCCPQCNQTSHENLVECQQCGEVGVKSYNFNIASSSNVPQCLLHWENIEEGESTAYYTCTKCLKCSVCGEVFTGPDVLRLKTSDYDRDVAELCGNDDHSNYYEYKHKNCQRETTQPDDRNFTNSTSGTGGMPPFWVICLIVIGFLMLLSKR